MDSAFYLDASALRAWHTCRFDWWLRYGLGYTMREEGKRLKAGSAYHLVLAEHHRGASVSECMRAFEWFYKQWSVENIAKPDDPYRYDNLYAILLHWLQTHPREELPYQVPEGFVEIPFMLPLDEQDGIYFCGRMDAIGAMGPHYAIVEGKSTRNSLTGERGDEWMEQWHDDAQVTGYLWGGRQLYEGIGGVLITALQIKEIPSSTNRCSKHQMKYRECGRWHLDARHAGPFYREQADIEEWATDALSAAREMRQLLIDAPCIEDAPGIVRDGRFHSACRWCEFKDPCRSGKDPDHFKRQLLHSPWDPRRAVDLPPWRVQAPGPDLIQPQGTAR